MADRDFIFWFSNELRRFLQPLVVGLSSEESFVKLLERYGWLADPDSFNISDIQNVLDIVDDLATAASLISEILSPATIEIPFETYGQLIEVFKSTAIKLQKLSTQPKPPGFSDELWTTFSQELLDGLVADYLDFYQPLSLAFLIFFGVVEEEELDFSGVEGRTAYTRRRIQWSRLRKAIDQPASLFSELYGWDNPEEPLRFELLLNRLERIFGLIGLLTVLDEPSEELVDAYYSPTNINLPKVKELRILLMGGENENGNIFEYSLNLLPIPPVEDPSAAPNGFVISPLFTADTLPSGILWPFTLEFSGLFQSSGKTRLEVEPGKVTPILDDPLASEVDAEVSIAFDSINPQVLMGTLFSHRLQLFGWKVSLHVSGALDDPEFSLELSFKNLQLVLDFSKADGFLKNTFGNEVQTLDFEVSIIWSSKTGLHFRGQAGLVLVFPVDRNISVVEVKSLTVGIRTLGDSLELVTGVTGNISLGPILVSVDNVGVMLLLMPVEADQPAGVFGDLDLGFDFKPPDGLGLAVDGGGFKGGGFLAFDPNNARYAGALELEFQDEITLKAIGLLTTRLPDGSDGFSLLIVISSEFTPIQLGLGFTLLGVGGLLGLNRTMKVNVLRQGIKDNSLASVLFPRNIIQNAARIISDLRQIFPPQSDRFVFGPMAKIGWGSPTLITIELGLFIEVPSPVTIALLGVLRALLPDRDRPLLRLQVNFLGLIEFDRELISFDASLFDSRLLNYPLTGDMVLRLGYGNNPIFVIAVGGFNPAFNPPSAPALPNLQRLTVNLVSGNNPRLILTTYFAITSNTVQFGARIDLLAKASKFKVVGFLAFDALFQFNPFYFIVAVSAMVAVKSGSSTLFSIHLDLDLEGPTPWKVKGTASFKILFFKVKVRFNKTFGQRRNTSLPDIVVLPLLQAALQEKNNWEARLPTRSRLMVSLKEMDDLVADYAVAHPAGTLTVSQKVVPLKTTIDKFGNQRPADANKFTITNVSTNGTQFNRTDVTEYFAPGQFQEMEDGKKLARKSFERMPSGVRVSSSTAQINFSKVVRRKIEHETIIIDTNFRRSVAPEKFPQEFFAFFSLLRGSFIAKSERSFARTKRSATTPEPIRVQQEGFAVVSKVNLSLVNENAVLASEAEADAYRRDLIAETPSLKSQIQVIPQYELN